MSIVRISKTQRRKFTVVSNTPINCNDIDWGELGLLTYLLSKPNGWNVSIKHLVKQKKSGETKVKTLLKSLQKNGYAQWKRLYTGRVEWTIYEEPEVDFKLEENDHIATYVENPHVENPQGEKPQVENQLDIVKTQPLVKTDNIINTELEQSKKKQPKLKPKSRDTWIAYANAYQSRYGHEPLRNAKVNKLLCNFVDEVGIFDAPKIASYYLSLNHNWYQTKSHDVATLLQNSQAIRTQWLNQTNKTSVELRRSEQTSSRLNTHNEVIRAIESGEI